MFWGQIAPLHLAPLKGWTAHFGPNGSLVSS